MKLQASLIIVPDWLTAATEAAKLSKQACLDLVSLQRILSQRDVSFYLGLNDCLHDKIPEPLRESFDCRVDLLYPRSGEEMKYVMTRPDGSRPTPQEFDEVRKSIQDAYYGWSIENSVPTAKNFLSLLPYMHEEEDAPVDPDAGFLFEVFNIREQIFGVRFYTPAKTSPFSEQLTECYSCAIDTLCVHHTFPDVARTRIFQEFVALSRQHRKPI